MASDHDIRLLRRFGMTKAWLRLGIVTRELLQGIYCEETSDGDVIGTEHVRYGALMEFLRETPCWSPPLFRDILGVLWDDPDRMMAASVLLSLAKHPGVTDDQLGKIREIAPEGIRKAVERTWLLKRLKREGVTDGLVEEALRLGDSILQSEILDSSGVSSEMLRSFSEAGATVKVRRRAKRMLDALSR